MKRASDIEISSIDTQSVEFQNALKLISYTRQSVFLTGKAGTGKSTFLKYLVNTTKKKFVVLAPTGIAAVNAGGQTIHSFFKLPFKPMLPNDPDVADTRRLRERLKYNKEKVKLLRSLDLIIIDEVSMVRADTIDFIDRILRVYCGNHREPFGGKQLLLVGDVFQLEPVITADTRDILSYYYKNGFFFFNAMAFNELSIVPIELRKVFRQTDSAFIEMLDRIRVGMPHPADIQLLNSKVIAHQDAHSGDFTMTIATRRDIVDEINQRHLNDIKRPERHFVGYITGDFPDNSLPTDKELILKEGAQVVFIRNDIEKRWVNGTIGRIEEFGDDCIIITLADGTRHEVREEIWENVIYSYDEEKKTVIEDVIGTFVQYPLKLAWALTIHKSQGLTFDRVIIDVGTGAFSGGQSYVALSRCRSLEGISMRSTINMRDIFVNQRVVNFSRTFNNDRLINHALEIAKADDLYHRAAVAFDRGDYAEAAQCFAEAVCARNMLARPDVVRLLRSKLHSINGLAKENAMLRKQLDDDKRRFARLATEYVELGEQCREEGWDAMAAINNYDKAIDLAPEYTYAWIAKGLALGEMGELDEAIDCLDHAAELDPSDFRPLLQAGRLLVNSGDAAQGMDYLLRALERNERHPDTHLALADGYDKLGDSSQADTHRRLAAKYRKAKKK